MSDLNDAKTVAYFDDLVPDYGDARLGFAATVIAERARVGASLIDLGCGTGKALRFLSDATGITDLVGVDVSQKSLAVTRERVGCDVQLGSIVDPGLATKVGRPFDFAVVAAVLHHLIGRTRSESRSFAQQAVHNAMSALKPGGHLLVFEPVWYPRVAMDALFYVKKMVSSVTPNRVSLLDTWNNIGAPVVSYYSNEELLRMVTDQGRGVVVAKDIDPDDLGRLNLVFNKTNTTILVRNAGNPVPTG